MKYLFIVVVVMFSAISAVAGNVDTFGIGARAASLGGAFSATADDVYAVYYNPAGLAGINTITVSGGAMIVSPSVSVDNYRVTGGAAQIPASPAYDNLQETGSFTNETKVLVSPHMGLAVPVTPDLVFGIAAYAPWGLETEWESSPETSQGSYNTFSAYYVREAVTPSFGYRLRDNLFIGAGVSIGRSRVGNDYVSAQSGHIVKASMEDDLNWSFNAGILYSPTERVSTGLTFRGRTETDFQGDLEIDGFGRVSALSMAYDHPEQIQAGFRYLAMDNRSLSLEADIVWTHWSINDVQTESLTPGVNDINEVIVPRYWNDTIQFKFGADWKIHPVMNLRCGYYYDPSPIPDTTMDFVWPDADKHTVSAGLGWIIGNVTIDTVALYSRTFEKRRINGDSSSLNQSYSMGPDYPASVSFDAEGHVWSVGMTISYTL